MSLAQDGTWRAGVWAQTVWAAGVWYEPATGGAKSSRKHKKVKYYRRDIEEEFRIDYGAPTVKQVENLVSSATAQIDDEPDTDDELILRALMISGILH